MHPDNTAFQNSHLLSRRVFTSTSSREGGSVQVYQKDKLYDAIGTGNLFRNDL